MIDDDLDLSQLMQQYLAGFDIDVKLAHTPSEGLLLLKQQAFDLLILDVMLPEMDGFEVCKKIRQDSDIPILMLTARGDLTDKVLGLELGCDDYLPKPFEPRELVARCQSLVRRAAKNSNGSQPIQSNPQGVILNVPALTATLDNTTIELTAMEADALQFLMQQQGEVVTRDDLLNHLRGFEADIFSRSIDILISRLRAKLKKLTDRPLIYTLRGKGYRFWDEETA